MVWKEGEEVQELGYCDPRWNCPGQLHRNLTSIRAYYLNRSGGTPPRWLNAPPLPILGLSLFNPRRLTLSTFEAIDASRTMRSGSIL